MGGVDYLIVMGSGALLIFFCFKAPGLGFWGLFPPIKGNSSGLYIIYVTGTEALISGTGAGAAGLGLVVCFHTQS